MVIHKKTRLTPLQRQEIYQAYHTDKKKVAELAREYHVSRPTIYKILARGRQRDFMIHRSTNKRFRCLQYGIKRLARIEAQLEAQRKQEAKRYNKDYPGQMMHGDTKRLPLLEGQKRTDPREYLFVAIDDCSRELYAAILPDKTQYAARTFLQQVLDECPYTIEHYYTDNGKEYQGDPRHHAFMLLCAEHGIEQCFTRVRTTRTNGKAERVIRTIMELLHEKTHFINRLKIILT